MAKRKKDRDEDESRGDIQDAAESEVVDEAPEAPAAPVVEEKAPIETPSLLKGLEAHFEVGQWRGFTQLSCVHCAWDTLDGAEAMREHLYADHLTLRGEARDILVADKRGNVKE